MDLFKLSGKIVVDDAEAKKKIDGVTGTARQAEGKMGSSFGKIGESVKKAFTVGAIVGFEKKVISTYKTYDDQMRKVQAVTDATGETYEKLRDKAEELGKSTRFSATEAGEGMEALGRAGWSADQIMAGIGETLTFATANTIDLGEASSIVADGLSQFGMKAEETGRFTDVLSMTARESNTDILLLGDSLKYVGPVAGALGYRLEDVSVALGLMANEGIKGGQAGTALRNVMTRMAKPTKESELAMSRLGLSLTDSNGNMKSFNEIMRDMRKGMEDLSPQQKAQYAAMLAGQQGMAGLLAIVNASEEDFNALTEAIDNSAGVTEDMANTMDGGLGGAIEAVKSAWENFLIQLGKIQDGLITAGIRLLAKAIEGLGDVVKIVNDLIQDFKKWLDENEKTAKILTAAMVAFGASLAIGPAINAIIGLLKMLGGGFTSVIGSISPVNVAVAIFAGLAMAIYENWDEISAWLSDMWENIKDTFQSAIDYVSNLVQTAWKPIGEFFTKVWETASDVLAFIWEFIKVTIENAITFVGAIIKTYLNIVKAFWQTVWNYIGDYVMDIWNEITNNIKRAIDTVKIIINTVMNVIKGIWAKIWGSIVNTTRKVWNNIKNTIEPIANAIKNTIQNIFNNIKNIVTNIWNNIKSVTSNVWNNIKNTISNVVNNIKNTVSNIFGGVANTARNRWQETRNNMVRPVEAARDKIRSALDKIKGFFSNLRLKFPKIEMPELPHFKLDGKFSLKPPSVPKLKVDWYKDGGILTDATIFGSQGDTLLGGGEAGAEAVLPIEKLGGIMADTMERLGYGNDNRERNITQNLTINTPKHLSPAETARENKKVLQRLALEL